MKNIFIALFMLFSIICKSQTKKNDFENNQKQLKRVWMLIEFKDFKKSDLIKNQAQLNLKNFKNPSAFAGCNQINFTMKIEKNKIKFNNIISTEMFCDSKMELENAFSKSLSNNFKFLIKGHTLTLTNSKNEKMVFVAQDWD